MAVVPSDEVRDGLPEGWNHLEHYIPGETKLIHYTAVPTQPWKNEDNPNGRLWEDAFVRACRAGYIDANLVERHITAGHVRRSLRSLVPATEQPTQVFSSALQAELAATQQELDRRDRLRPKRVISSGANRMKRFDAKQRARAHITTMKRRGAALLAR